MLSEDLVHIDLGLIFFRNLIHIRELLTELKFAHALDVDHVLVRRRAAREGSLLLWALHLVVCLGVCLRWRVNLVGILSSILVFRPSIPALLVAMLRVKISLPFPVSADGRLGGVGGCRRLIDLALIIVSVHKVESIIRNLLLMELQL